VTAVGSERRPPLTDLGLKITWLTVFRTVTTTVLLVSLAARLLSRARPENLSTGDLASFLLIGAVYVITLVNGLLLRRGQVGLRAAWAQVASDVVLASSFVFLTGGPESPFVFVYLVAIIAASVLLSRRGALVAGGASMIVYAALVYAMREKGLVEPSPVSATVLQVGTQLVAQLLVAVLSGYLAEQLSQAGGQLSASERNLRHLEALQDEIVNAIPSGLITCDPSGLVTFVNPAAQGILGVEASIVGRPLEQVLPGVQRHLSGAGRFELEVQSAKGQRVLGLSMASLGPELGTLVVFQDLTELRRMQMELRRIDSLAGLGRTVAQMAHEVRNPLASLRGSAQLLAEDMAEGSPQARLTSLIVRESDRLAALVDGYLTLARPPPPRLERVALDELVEETIEMLRHDPLFVGTQIDSKTVPSAVEADASQLKQVLINLLRNATAAAGRGGRVKVSVEKTQAGVAVQVWDSAGAVPEADAGRIFEPFYSTKEGGTGLGLSTAKSIVLAHGGTIDVESSPAAGTSFTVRFPEAREAKAS
jgi:two-component system sensor histidine kinase PilS (NtrC family)